MYRDRFFFFRFVKPGMPVYYQCPDCGFKQRSKAEKRVKCHRCGRSYLKRDAKKTEKSGDGTEGFFRFKKS